jgi:hypothetical protein
VTEDGPTYRGTPWLATSRRFGGWLALILATAAVTTAAAAWSSGDPHRLRVVFWCVVTSQAVMVATLIATIRARARRDRQEIEEFRRRHRP